MNDAAPPLVEAMAYLFLPWLAMVQQVPGIAVVVQIMFAWAGVYMLHRFGTTILMRMAAPFPFSRSLVANCHRAGRMVVFLILVQVILRSNEQAFSAMPLVLHLCALLLITSITWLAVRVVRAIAEAIVQMHPALEPDNLEARRVVTQTKVLSRTMMALIVLIGSGMALSTLPLMRQLGTSLLASAGVAGLVVGFAAKPVLGNLLAGLQLAVTQPMRLDDVVIVKNEWGWIEEITGTYVVLRIWDQRRLIIPLQWFIENPFQNWTRSNADLLGSVEFWADFSLPVEEIRTAASRFCETAPEWDQRLCVTQVVDANDKAMKIRLLVSAADAARCWDLRCRMREWLIGYVAEHYPDALPQFRSVSVASPHDPG